MYNVVSMYTDKSKKIREAIDRINTINITISNIINIIVDVTKTIETLEANITLITTIGDDTTKTLLSILKPYTDILDNIKVMVIDLAERIDTISKTLKGDVGYITRN